jgi:hypothetical protein
MPEPIVERTIAITRTLRSVAHAVMERAFDQRAVGELDMEGFLVVSERYQAMINQANRTLYQVAESLPSLGAHIEKIEQATHQLEVVAGRLRDAKDVVTIASQLLVALSALTLAVVRPDAAAVAATVDAITTVSETIRARIISR